MNRKFSQEPSDDSPFAPREFIAGNDSFTLAQDIMVPDQDAFSAAFRKSPVKRAKSRNLLGNAAGVLGNPGAADGQPS